MKNSLGILRLLVVVAHIATPFSGVVAATNPPALHGPSGLPAPSVSRALDAVVLPIDKAVIKKFKLDKKERGLLVISVKPGGTADKQGFKPGDVISEVRGHKVRKPIDIDVAVRRELKAGHPDCSFAVRRGGALVAIAATITIEAYDEALSVSEISTWESVSSESAFSYSEFVSEETTTMEASYESEKSVVDEDLSQEESATEDDTDEAAEEDTADSSDEADDSSDDSGDDSSDDSSDDGE